MGGQSWASGQVVLRVNGIEIDSMNSIGRKTTEFDVSSGDVLEVAEVNLSVMVMYDIISTSDGSEPSTTAMSVTMNPTLSPTQQPTMKPTFEPSTTTMSLTMNPTLSPTEQPTMNPTFEPSTGAMSLTMKPTLSPTFEPSTRAMSL